MVDDDFTGRENEAGDDVSVQLDSGETLMDRGGLYAGMVRSQVVA